MKKAGIAILTSLATLAGGATSVFAATTQQGLTTQTQQDQWAYSSNGTVNQQENSNLAQPNQQSKSQTTSSDNPNPFVSEGQIGTGQSGQSTGTTTGNEPNSKGSTFAGFAVFDAQGNMISDTWGLNLSKSARSRLITLDNSLKHYDLLSDKAVSLVIKAVDANGDPIPSPVTATVSIRTTSGWNVMTYNGQFMSKLKIVQGSTSVSFDYTDGNGISGYGNIDVAMGNVETVQITASQHESVSSPDFAYTSQWQYTTLQSGNPGAPGEPGPFSPEVLGPSMGGTILAQTSQGQEVFSEGAATLTLSEKASTTAVGVQQSGTGTSTAAATTINVQQTNSGQSEALMNASQSQSVSFAAGSQMRLDLTQQQSQSGTSFSQTETIQAQVQNQNTATSGTLTVYSNGALQGTYSGVTGTVTATENQSTGSSSNADIIITQNGNTRDIPIS